MEKELVVQGSTEILSLDFIEMRVNKIQEIMSKLMKKDVHYGTIPGCGKKKGLFKAGAEVLCLAFQLEPRYEYEIIELGNLHREYRFKGEAIYIPTGQVIAPGIGSCSTMEVKYRYRESLRKCPACGQETIIKGKEEYGGGWVCFAKKGGCGKKFKDGDKQIESQTIGRIENPDIAEQYNTVFKMAKKRFHTDVTLSATGASFLFTQGEDNTPPEGNKETPPKKQPSMAPPESKSEPKKETKKSDNSEEKITEPQIRAIFALFKDLMGNIPIEDVRENCGTMVHIENLKSIKVLTFQQASDIISNLNEALKNQKKDDHPAR